jgi:hypothetical protein
MLAAVSDRQLLNGPALLVEKKRINVMLTVTTCKRFDLFEQTINSMKKSWKDLESVDYFFCVDDNSSPEDRMKMQIQYPFFNYYMKSADEKGHRESMNIIWAKLHTLKPTFWIHMEDDFLFYNKTNYVEESIQGLKEMEMYNVKQILFNNKYTLNKNFTHTADDYIYSSLKTYIYKYPYFTYSIENDSTIHDWHLDYHNYAKVLALMRWQEIYDFKLDKNYKKILIKNKILSKKNKLLFYIILIIILFLIINLYIIENHKNQTQHDLFY